MANKNTNPGGGKNADSGVMHNPQSSRAHTRTRVWAKTHENTAAGPILARAYAYARGKSYGDS